MTLTNPTDVQRPGVIVVVRLDAPVAGGTLRLTRTFDQTSRAKGSADLGVGPHLGAVLLTPLALMFSHGAGSELRQPLGYAMVGGLALSQVLTLFTTPVVYLYLDRLQTWLSGERHDAPHEDEDAARVAAQ